MIDIISIGRPATQPAAGEVHVALALKPYGKPRPIVERGRARMPDAYNAWRTQARWHFGRLPGWDVAKAHEPVELSADLYCQRPQRRPKHVDPALWKSGLHYLATKTPDRDNAVGAIMDALNGVAWHDDCQVQLGRVYMWVCAEGGQPRCEITLRRLGLHGGPA